MGCGRGHSTILMAEACPAPRFHGYDVLEAGFSRFRRATETPFNMVLEARP